jgi:hypothetical protein
LDRREASVLNRTALNGDSAILPGGCTTLWTHGRRCRLDQCSLRAAPSACIQTFVPCHLRSLLRSKGMEKARRTNSPTASPPRRWHQYTLRAFRLAESGRCRTYLVCLLSRRFILKINRHHQCLAILENKRNGDGVHGSADETILQKVGDSPYSVSNMYPCK